jgi:hypothetical protein
LALAGVLRTLVLADREVDAYELDALDDVGRRVALSGAEPERGPYRSRVAAMGADEFRAIFGDACRRLPTDASVRAALEAVTRPEAREVIFAIARDVAACNGIAPVEQEILDWLIERWGLVVENVGGPEDVTEPPETAG